MVCMVRLSDVEIALEYAEQQQCDVTQLAQVYLLTVSGYILRFISLSSFQLWTNNCSGSPKLAANIGLKWRSIILI